MSKQFYNNQPADSGQQTVKQEDQTPNINQPNINQQSNNMHQNTQQNTQQNFSQFTQTHQAAVETRVSAQTQHAPDSQRLSNQNADGQQFTISQIYTAILLGLLFLLPLLVIPFTNNFITHTKLILIFIGVFVTGGFFLYQAFKEKAWKFILSPLTLPLVLFGLASIGSALLTQNYPAKNLLGVGSAYIGLALIPLLGGALGDKKLTKWLVPTLSVSAALLSVSGLLQMVGYGPTQLINAVTGFNLEHNLLFNLAGSSLVAVQFILIALVGTVVQIMQNKQINTLHTITLPVLLLGLGLHVWSLLPGQPAQLLLTPIGASWSVALDSMRAPRTALIGFGPESYSSIFSRYRPVWLNGTEFWQVSFNSGFGLPLTILVQLGILGLAAWTILFIKFFKSKNQKYGDADFKKSPITWMLGLSFILQLFLTPSIALLGLQAFLILFWIIEFKDEFSTIKLKALSASIDGKTTNPAARNEVNRWITLGTTGLLTAGLIFLVYSTGRAWAGFHQAYLANQGFMENDAVKVYDHQRQAVILNPYLDQHRRAYALTNLDIAIALSNEAEVTEQQQEQIGLLIGQAVREGRAATTIDPVDSRNWAVLAQIYQNLIGSAEEAEQWAVSAYIEAISGDPTNPLLRLQLGHILLGQEQIQQALNVYEQTINLKPNLPAGYFHLGAALVRANQLEQAQQAWQTALSLLNPETQDYQTVQEALAQLEQEIEAAGLTGEPDLEGIAGEEGLPEDGIPGETPLSREIDLTQQNLEERGEQTVAPRTDVTDLELEESPTLRDEDLLEESELLDRTEDEGEEDTEDGDEGGVDEGAGEE